MYWQQAHRTPPMIKFDIFFLLYYYIRTPPNASGFCVSRATSEFRLTTLHFTKSVCNGVTRLCWLERRSKVGIEQY